MGYNRLMQKYIKEEMHNFMRRGSVPIGRPIKLNRKKSNTSWGEEDERTERLAIRTL